MRKLFVIISIIIASFARGQAPLVDTINSNSYEEAMEMAFGLLHNYPTGILLDKSSLIEKIRYFDGSLNDSSANVYDWYFTENAVRNGANERLLYKDYFSIDSIKEKYIEEFDVLPIGVLDINCNRFDDSVFIKNKIIVQNYRLVENSDSNIELYKNYKIFSVVPLREDVYTLQPKFILLDSFFYSNNEAQLLQIYINLDDGNGFVEVAMNTIFQANYINAGYKNIISKFVYANGDTLFSRSEIYVNDPNVLDRLNSVYEPYAYKVEIWSSPFTYPSEFSVGHAPKKVEMGVWWGCNNSSGEVRKPFIIFAGYNPKDGKSLEYNGFPPWVNSNFGAVMGEALGGWRGPLYETYDGFFVDESKNANGGQSFGSNGANLLNRLRKEDYDVFIVRFDDGIGHLQRNAHLVTRVIDYINDKINTSGTVHNPGAALDPEALGYPNTNQRTKPKHEIIVAGYSAGALSSRMGLLLMEYQYEKFKCTPDAPKYPQHRVKTWIGMDCENQGSNTPIGFQMFLDFEGSLMFFPANQGDVLNSLMSKLALNLMGEHGVATQNTLYHTSNMTNVNGEYWNVGHNSDFDDYFADLTAISIYNPPNLKGYPLHCFRIGVSQGNANGIQQLMVNDDKMIFNQSPSQWCNFTSSYFGPTTYYRKAEGRILTPSNGNAFKCNLGLSINTFFYSWYINIGHWKYKKNNYIIDSKHYDVAAGSTLPSHKILGTKMLLSFESGVGSFLTCNLKEFSKNQHGFSPTVSGLDIHLPGQNALPRLPNLNLVPGNVSGGLNLMKQNKYNNIFEPSPNSDFGYPHLTFPNNHYDYTPLDAIWANNRNDVNYNSNTMHVEDPNPHISEFLVEEIAPFDLYLSNRTIEGDHFFCGNRPFLNKYYADFEARNSVLIGNQEIYLHDNNSPYPRQRTPQGDFTVGDGGVVTVRANNFDGASSVVLAPGFSAKAGSIFRAYVYGNNLCGPFGARLQSNEAALGPPQAERLPRKIKAETKNYINVSNNLGAAKVKLEVYPNPTNGSVFYKIEGDEIYYYTIKDVTGKLIAEGKISISNNSIELTQLKAGVYLITLIGVNIKQSDKIILQ